MKRLLSIMACAALIVAACVEYPRKVEVSSVIVSPTTLELIEGETSKLTVTVIPEDASDKTVTWSTSDASIASVDDGVVTANAAGNATITAHAGGKEAICSIIVTTSSAVVPEAVDLGLPSGLKWATFNVGAKTPEGYGDYFAWGETEPYYEKGYAQSKYPVWKAGKSAGYYWPSYKWCKGTYSTLTKYNTSAAYGIVDKKITLDLKDDAAYINWGGSWRMPTDAEWTELKTKCKWTWTTQKGINGRKVTGPNGNSIFLPAASYRSKTILLDVGAYGYYWSSSLKTGSPSIAMYVRFDSDEIYESIYYYVRSDGNSVRAVTEQ